MNKSESIANLALALSKLQGEIQNVYKDKKGYGYSYTELSSMLEVTRPLCAKYELAVTQLCESHEVKNEVGVETVLMHSSGEWISSTLFMPAAGSKGMSLAQASGSVITYARRYALAALLGIAQTDNDASIKDSVQEEAVVVTNLPVNYSKLVDVVKEFNISGSEVRIWCQSYGVERLSELSDTEILEILKMLGQQ